MDSNLYWEAFLRTGKIADYINYKRSYTEAVEDYANQDGRAYNRAEKNR